MLQKIKSHCEIDRSYFMLALYFKYLILVISIVAVMNINIVVLLINLQEV